ERALITHQHLSITLSGTKYWIPQCDGAIKPYNKGQKFRELHEAVNFYMNYAVVCLREGYKHHATVGPTVPGEGRVTRRDVECPTGLSRFCTAPRSPSKFRFLEKLERGDRASDCQHNVNQLDVVHELIDRAISTALKKSNSRSLTNFLYGTVSIKRVTKQAPLLLPVYGHIEPGEQDQAEPWIW
ncbi:pyruvate decarboxylase 1, partial [Striga asiatica]